MGDFKVGDWVKVVSGGNTAWDNRVGTVVSVTHSAELPRFPYVVKFPEGTAPFQAQELEAWEAFLPEASPETPPPAPSIVVLEDIPPAAYVPRECYEPHEVAETLPSGPGGQDRKHTNPKDRAATARLDISLFPQTAIAFGALAMTEGDCKYGGYNYREAGVSASVYYSGLQRHMSKWYNGEWADPKTGVPHLASALANIGVIIDAHVAGVLKDDRPPAVDMGALLDEFEGLVKKLQTLFPDGPGRHTERKVAA